MEILTDCTCLPKQQLNFVTSQLPNPCISETRMAVNKDLSNVVIMTAPHQHAGSMYQYVMHKSTCIHACSQQSRQDAQTEEAAAPVQVLKTGSVQSSVL